jgi:limonene-1,2-epoxide hydrolase
MQDRVSRDVKADCAEVIVRYAMAVNENDIDAFVALFTEDATWQRPGVPALHGHDEIHRFMSSLPVERVVRHVNGASFVQPVSATEALAWSQTTVYEERGSTVIPASVTGPDMVVEYRDRLVRDGDTWRFARREATVVFRADR